MEQFVKQGHGFFALALSGDAASLPGVPRASQYVKDDHGRRLLALVETLSEIGRLTAGPPGMPANVLAAEREALRAAMTDPQLLAEAKKLNLDIDPPLAFRRPASSALNQPPETSPPSNLPPADDITKTAGRSRVARNEDNADASRCGFRDAVRLADDARLLFLMAIAVRWASSSGRHRGWAASLASFCSSRSSTAWISSPGGVPVRHACRGPHRWLDPEHSDRGSRRRTGRGNGA
jgi:hypothetical protein